MKRVHLTDRGVLRLTGPDTQTFLQGLVSNDVKHADGTRAVYAALLTPQGKFLYDFFMIGIADGVLIDCRADDLPTFSKKLRMFKLRSDVTLEDVSADYTVHAFFDTGAEDLLGTGESQRVTDSGIILFRDPRLNEAGLRALVPSDADATAPGGDIATSEDYQQHRIALGLPEAPVDLQTEKSILLESGFDELNGVDWDKGCYMGQELTARTKYRGLVKKRLVPVTLSEPVAPGTEIVQDGKVVGDIRSVFGTTGIASLRLQALSGVSTLLAGEAAVTARVPAWMTLPEDA